MNEIERMVLKWKKSEEMAAEARFGAEAPFKGKSKGKGLLQRLGARAR